MESEVEELQVLFQKLPAEPTSAPESITCARSGAPDFVQFGDGPNHRSCIERRSDATWRTERGVFFEMKPLRVCVERNSLKTAKRLQIQSSHA
jgi:hypothetical protein